MLGNKIKVIVSDEFAIIRKGIRSQLSSVKNISVIDEASNGRELLDKLKLVTPDIVVLDASLPLIDGFQLLDIIRQKYSGLKTLITSFKDDYLTIGEAYAKGTCGFISKKDENCCIIEAVKKVYNEGKYFNMLNSESILRGYMNEKRLDSAFQDRRLSQRETEIMRELCNGLTNNSISQKLNISPSTVDFHKRNIYRKTNSKKIVDLIKFALKNQLILLE